MLHRYAFSNFQSFRERTEVDWSLNRRQGPLGWSATADSGERLSTVMAVIGPNASGKTTLLKPLLFVVWFLSHSFGLDATAALPLRAHAGAAPDEPTEFEVEADVDGRLMRYVLRCTAEKVLHEALYERHERMRYVFVRDWNATTGGYDVKQQDFGLAPAEAKKVRPNASLVATAAQYGVPLAIRLAQSRVFTNVNHLGKAQAGGAGLAESAHFFAQEEGLRQTLVDLLTRWDLGLEDVLFREMQAAKPDGSTERFWLPIGVHRLSAGKTFELPFLLESSGTQSALTLLRRVLPVLKEGGLAVVDEFESDLHPQMLEPILNLFADPKTNPHKAQLLFTCHAIEVLNLLQKSQVMLVEKRHGSESTAWRLDSVQGVRSDDNLYAKYMAGAYGATPQL